MNSCFESYRNIHVDESVTLFFPGPSLGLYLQHDLVRSGELEPMVKVGCNSIAMIDDLSSRLDYYFIGDPIGTGGGHTNPPSPTSFRCAPDLYLSCEVKRQKFCRTLISEFLGGKPDGFEEYHTSRYPDKNHIYYPVDIVHERINRVSSISMDMMQFCLFCGFKKIFLVGQDCNYAQGKDNSHYTGHVKNVGAGYHGPRILRFWKHIKNHIDKNFPDVEIYIVNPVSLNIWPSAKIEDMVVH